MQVKIACAQIQSGLGDKDGNLKKMSSYIQKIKEEDKDVQLIVFPELAITGYECGELFQELAESFPEGKSLNRLAAEALKWNVHLIFGFVEEAEENNEQVLYNSAALVNNKGKVIGCCRKSHLVEGEETKYFKKGIDYNVYETEIGKIGMMICWDTAYPEVARILALKGAEIIAVPAAWEEPMGGDWDIVHMARSFDNVVYIAACNHVGTDRDLTFFGKSKIVGPIGRTVAEAGGEEGIVKASIDLDAIHELRDGYYVLLKDRNPDTYVEIIKEKED